MHELDKGSYSLSETEILQLETKIEALQDLHVEGYGFEVMSSEDEKMFMQDLEDNQVEFVEVTWASLA